MIYKKLARAAVYFVEIIHRLIIRFLSLKNKNLPGRRRILFWVPGGIPEILNHEGIIASA